MKDISHIPPATAAPGAFVTETIDRYLGGLTTPVEEQQLRSALETKEAQGTVLNADERAALALLRLSFPEEDAAALLTEDCSIEYEELSGANKQASARLAGSGHQSRSRNALALRGHIHRIAATLAAVAAVMAIALIIVLGKSNRAETLTAQAVQSTSRTSDGVSRVGNSSADERQETESLNLSHDSQEKEQTAPQKTMASHVKSVVTRDLKKPSRAADRYPNSNQTESVQHHKDSSEPSQDPDGAAILATEQQRILEVEQAARQRAIAVTQENTLACVTAASPS